MSEKEKISLRDTVFGTLVEGDGPKARIVEILSKYQEVGDADDIAYAILFEMEIMQKTLEKIHAQSRQSTSAMFSRLEKLLEKDHERMLEIVFRQQAIGRSQFRKIFALHRERLLTRIIMICSLGILSIFAGLGVFYFYILVVG